ncbi:MAG: bifunctional (p)ppGpp synthetase/guanosine-3',5'-bis(diphosphate) 3'-pyrophosphohydrolase [Candidatus Doudnabacteria bacterium]|nr:bifunctional (p)ppGpp synthetase/guanosine-3',5'-bis(diphosphate) 3'-pyrophosphohydrolase [Candidatus Doudnabacteria bacterium]
MSTKDISIAEIIKALDLVTKSAKGEKRSLVYQVQDELSPYPYWGHLNAVLEQLIVSGVEDQDILIAGILHDIVEDHNVSLEKIETRFGSNVRVMVELCTKPNDFDNKDESSVAAYYKRIFDYIEINERLALGAMQIKICDRITNLIGVQFIEDTEKKKRYIYETKEYFIPMSQRAGLFNQMSNVLLFAEALC